MNSALRTDEKAFTNTRPESDASFLRLFGKIASEANKRKEQVKTTLPQATQISQNTNGVVQKKTEAFLRNLRINQSKWLRKRGFYDSQDVASISKQVFAMLDSNKTGEIPATDFLDFLIEIGVPIDESILTKVIIWTLKCKTIEGEVINHEGVNAFCRGDKRSDQILKVLSDHLGSEFTTLEVLQLIRKWWDQLGAKVVGVNIVADFLCKLEIFSDFSEAKKSLIKINQNDLFVTVKHFITLFGKAIVKHCLMNINKKFSELDWNNPHYSLAYKLCQLKKQLILAGIKYPISQISYEEGQLALKAIQKLEKFKSDKEFNYEEFKHDWYKLTGFALDTFSLAKATPEEETKRSMAVFHPKTRNEVSDAEEESHSATKSRIDRGVYEPESPWKAQKLFTNNKKPKNLSPDQLRKQAHSKGLKEFQRLIER